MVSAAGTFTAEATELPQNGQVAAGEIHIQTLGDDHLRIEQSSQTGVINWRTFSISDEARVEFRQPSATAATLNRVTGGQASVIRGQLDANGRVILVNAAGILFTANAEVNVGALIASTLDMTDADFLADNYIFSGESQKSVTNQGVISSAPDGFVALFAAHIVNDGTIQTPKGTAILAAAKTVRLRMGAAIQLDVDSGALQAQIDNAGAIIADDGTVYLTAKAASELQASVINHAGVIEATSLTARGGRVMLEADHIDLLENSQILANGSQGGGEVLVGGDWQGGAESAYRVLEAPEQLRAANHVSMAPDAEIQANATTNGDGGTVVLWSDVSNPTSTTQAYGRISADAGPLGGNGGFIETSGAVIKFGGVSISTSAAFGAAGQWLIDPETDLNLGDIDTTSELNSILNALATSDVRVYTISSDIIIDVDIIYAGSNKLTFESGSRIYIRDSVQAGSLVFWAEDDIIVDVNGVVLTTNNPDPVSGELIISANYVDNANGAPRFDNPISIVTNGGNVTIGGGNAQGTSFPNATSWNGIGFTGLDITTNGGDIAIRGESDNSPGLYFGGSSTVLNSGGGDIFLDGQTEHDNGIKFVNAVTLNSGTGTIYIRGRAGVEANSSSNVDHGLYFHTSAVDIISANPTSAAITLIGEATTGRGIDLDSGRFTLQSTSTQGGIVIDGLRGSSRNWAISLVGSSVEILAAGGLIDIMSRDEDNIDAGDDSYLNLPNAIIGRKAGTGVATSSADIRITVNRFQPSIVTHFNTTGSVEIQPFSPSFSETIYTSSFRFNSDAVVGGDISEFTFGKVGNTTLMRLNTDFTVAGPISVYGGDINITHDITSSGNGDIFLKAISGGDYNIKLSSIGSLIKSGGSGTFTAQAHGRVFLEGPVKTLAGGLLNMVLWSDYNDSNDGGASILADVETGGGHVWIGGSSSNGGSYQWNGLTVGDGPSVGNANANRHAMDLYADITTNGGDILIWAGAGYSTWIHGIGTNGGHTVNSGSGDITLITDAVDGSGAQSISFETTGVFTLAPNDGAFASNFDWNPSVSGNDWEFPGGNFNYMRIADAANLTGLTVGRYSGMTQSGTAMVQGNSSDVTISTDMSISGPISLYGANVSIAADLSTGSASDILVQAAGDLEVEATQTLTTNGGNVVLWANSDGGTTFGSVILRNNSVITTNSGHIWIGGSASNGGSTTWNGLTVGDGYAVSGSSITPVVSTSFYAGVYLENADLFSGGGDISIFAKDSSVGVAGAQRAFVNLGSSEINAGTGQILMDVVGINDFSIATGMHNFSAAANFVMTSAFDDPSDYAIDISVSTSGNNALIAEGDTTFSATGRGKIRLNAEATIGSNETGLLLGWGGVSVGHLKVLAESGSIELNTGASSVSVANSSSSGTIGSLAGTVVADSESNIAFIADDISASGPLVFRTSGTLTMRSSGLTFSGNVDLSTLDVGTDLGGLQIGTATNTANLLFGKDLTVAGPITAYGGDITINAATELTAGSGADIVLAGSGDFINNSGSGALSVSGGGRWMVYAGDTSNNVYGALDSGNAAIFNQDVSGLAPGLVPAGNRYIFASAGLQEITMTTLDASKIYGESIDISGQYTLVSSGIAGEAGVYSGVSTAPNAVAIGDVFSVNPTLTSSKTPTTAPVGSDFIIAAGGTANNGYIVSYVNTGTLTVTPRPITVLADPQTKIYGAVNPALTYTIVDLDGDATLPNGDGLVGALATSIATLSDVGTGTITQGSLTDANNGNYAILFTSAGFSVTPKSLSLSGFSVSDKVYDGLTVASIASAGTLSGLELGDSVSFSYDAPHFDNQNIGVGKTVTLSNIALNGPDAGNYMIAATATDTATITALTVTLSGFDVLDKVYDGTTGAVVSTIGTLVGVLAGETVTVTHGGATFGDQNVGLGKLVTLAAINLAGADAGNYAILPTATTLADITPKTLSLAGFAVADKTYDATAGATLVSAGTLQGVVLGDVVNFSHAGADFDDANAQVNKTVTLTGVALGGADASNYTIAPTAVTTATIDKQQVLLIVAGRPYSGDADLSGQVSIITGILGEDLDYSGATAASSHVGGPDGDPTTADNYLATLTLEDDPLGSGLAANYELPPLNAGTAPVAITPRVLNVSLANNAVSKTYDGTVNAPSGFTPDFSISGLLSGDTVGLLYMDSAYDAATVAAASRVIVSGLSLSTMTSSHGALLSDYTLNGVFAVDGAATITPAPLTVPANNDARFSVQPEDPNYAGVSFAGFVNNEDSRVVGGTLSIARSEFLTNPNGVGTYQLTPSGLTADNYTLIPQDGIYRIVPADSVIVRLLDVTETYATTPTYQVSSAEYMLSGGAVQTINAGDIRITNDRVSFVDAPGAYGTGAAFDINVLAPVYSSAGALVVGSYQLGSTNATYDATRISNGFVVLGARAVEPKPLIVDPGAVSKPYDGTTGMEAVTIGLLGLENNDVVAASGVGSYQSSQVDPAARFDLSNLAISGADAANYFLTSGRTLSAIGAITPRDLTLSFVGIDRVYDGSTTASVTISDNRIAGDDVTFVYSADFADKNVGTNKAITVGTVLLAGGGDASNYNLVTVSGSATASISRLASVTWTGGGDGTNWFDPDNWGGAIPDLNNVADVIIPTPATAITFDPTQARGVAETGSVSVASISAQGTLAMNQGVLAVEAGGVRLDHFTQAGGDFSSAGDLSVDTMTITAGTAAITGDVTVTDNFTQSAGASLDIGGDADITDLSGGIALGEIAVGGDFNIESRDGAISQIAGTRLDGAGTVSATAFDGTATYFDVILDAAANRFASAVNVTGQDLTLSAASDLVLGDLSAQTDFAVTAGGDVEMVGAIVVTGNTSITTAGALSQSAGRISTTGDVALSAGDAIALTQANNDFGGSVSVRAAADVALVDAQTLTLGDVVSTGDVSLRSRQGDITLTGDVTADALSAVVTTGGLTQSAGTLAVSGDTNIAVAQNIALTSTSNDFVGPLSASGLAVQIKDRNDLTIGTISASAAVDLSTEADLTLEGRVLASSVNARAGGAMAIADITTSQGAVVLTAGSDVALNGAVSSANDLTVTSGGSVTQTAQSQVAATGEADVQAQENITLDGSLAAGSDVSLTARAGAVAIAELLSRNGGVSVTSEGSVSFSGAVDIADGLSVVSASGDIQQRSGAITVSSGASSLRAGGAIDVAGAQNVFFEPVTADGTSVALGASGDLTLGAATADTVFNVTSYGLLNLAGAISASDLYATSRLSDVILGHITVGNMTVTAQGDIDIVGPVAVAAAFSATAGNNIRQRAGSVFTVDDGPTALTVGDGEIALLETTTLPGLVVEDASVREVRTRGASGAVRDYIAGVPAPDSLSTSYAPNTNRVLDDITTGDFTLPANDNGLTVEVTTAARVSNTQAVSIGSTGRVFKMVASEDARALNIETTPEDVAVGAANDADAEADSDTEINTALADLVTEGQVLVISGGISLPDEADAMITETEEMAGEKMAMTN